MTYGSESECVLPTTPQRPTNISWTCKKRRLQSASATLHHWSRWKVLHSSSLTAISRTLITRHYIDIATEAQTVSDCLPQRYPPEKYYPPSVCICVRALVMRTGRLMSYVHLMCYVGLYGYDYTHWEKTSRVSNCKLPLKCLGLFSRNQNTPSWQCW